MTTNEKAAAKQAANDIFSKMSPGALANYNRHTKSCEFFPNYTELTKRVHRWRGKRDDWMLKDLTSGAYDYTKNHLSLVVDSDTSRMKGVFAHEFAHAVSGDYWAHDVKWETAWKAEIYRGAPLSDYATQDRSEGFAEFGRAHWTGAVDDKTLQTKFPKCVSYWKEKKIW